MFLIELEIFNGYFRNIQFQPPIDFYSTSLQKFLSFPLLH